MNKYSAFFAAYNASVKRGNPLSKEEMISDFTNGNTTSLKDLSWHEVQELTRKLNYTSGNTQLPPKYNTLEDRMRKGIIAIFHRMDRTPKDAIAWAEKQGVKGNKRKFNDYSTQELYVLIGVAEIILSDWQKGIRNRMETTGDLNINKNS